MRRFLALGAALYAALIAYGSLVPFHFEPLSFQEWMQTLRAAITSPVGRISKSDFAANILLFIPLGLLLAATFDDTTAVAPSRFNRFGLHRWLGAVVTLGLCTLYGSAIESLQILFPPRNCSRFDILAQSIGSAFGAGIWLISGRSLAEQVRSHVSGLSDQKRPLLLLVAYILLMLIVETAPFDFTLSPAELGQKWREGRIRLIPLSAFADPNLNMVPKTLWTIVLFLPAGALLGWTWPRRPSALSPSRASDAARTHQQWTLAFCLAIPAAIEGCQFFVLSRNFEPTDVITGAVTMWLVCRLTAYRIHATGAFSPGLRMTLLIAWTALILVVNWFPFQFSPENVEEHIQQVSWIPFSDYQQKQYLFAFDDIVHKLMLFIPMGCILATFPFWTSRSWMIPLLGALVSAIVESGQLFLPERYASLSDVFLAAASTYGGAWIVRRCSSLPVRDKVKVSIAP